MLLSFGMGIGVLTAKFIWISKTYKCLLEAFQALRLLFSNSKLSNWTFGKLSKTVTSHFAYVCIKLKATVENPSDSLGKLSPKGRSEKKTQLNLWSWSYLPDPAPPHPCSVVLWSPRSKEKPWGVWSCNALCPVATH